MTSTSGATVATSTLLAPPTPAVRHRDATCISFNPVRWNFSPHDGTLTADETHPQGCCVEVAIEVASIDTGSPDRDAHLRGSDFFDAERFATIRFHSDQAEGSFEKEGDRFRVPGKLTIRDTTIEVVLDCVFQGRGNDPWGKERAGFSCSTEIDRRDWGLKWNQALETGGILVGNSVRIEIEAQAIRQQAGRAAVA